MNFDDIEEFRLLCELCEAEDLDLRLERQFMLLETKEWDLELRVLHVLLLI
jgi:hypothetical protein